MRDLRWAWWALLPWCSVGCVTVYQPLVGLQRPVALSPASDNFKGLKLRINCLPNDYLDRDESEQLCRQTGKLFTNQGAVVQTSTRRGPLEEAEDEKKPAAATDVDLEVELTARLLHEENSMLLWILSIGTATLVPAVTEFTFAQDVTVRDKDGFLLATDDWQARFVRYMGALIWSVNWLLDLGLRKPSDKLTGDAMEQDFSRDYYRQLTQLVFNAQGRWRLLHSSATAPARP